MAAMPRLSAPSRRDCSPDSALAARSRRGGFPSLHRCIAAVPAALFALAALMLGTVAPAQAAVLISNIGQSDDRNYNVGTGFAGQDLAQGFTTGASGATLTGIEIRMDTSSGTHSSVPTATLHRGSPTSAAVATLTGPSEIANAAANYAFTAPANTTLAASTTYYVVLEGGAVDIRARVTNSDNEDSGAETGWSVADGGGFRRDSSTAAFTDISQALLIRVNGTVITAPGTPQDFKVSAGDAQVALTWAAPASDGGGAITEYEYRYSTGAMVSSSATWTDVTDGSDDGDSTADETGVTVSSLTNGTEYAFEVRAVNSAGDGTAAGPVTATPVTAPDAPMSFMATAGDGEVTLSWAAPASNGGASITEYEYRHAAGGTVPEGTAWVDVVDGSDDGASAADETGVTVSSLTNGTEYAFEVRAVNSVGDGAAAGPVTATPTVANSVPTSADKTVTTNEDTAYTFGASDFAFSDIDGGDALASVTLVTLPGVGTLALDGTDVTAADVVSKADIDDSKLVFTPAPNGNGTPYTTFTFRVSDGTAESASAYTLTVTVTALNDAATGQPSITGTALVGQTLTASTPDIADIDGKTKAEDGDTGFAYTYQWVRVASDMTETDISGATSDSYILVAGDLDKQVKVKVRFKDDGGTARGRSPAPRIRRATQNGWCGTTRRRRRRTRR